MLAILNSRSGGPEVLEAGEVDDPVPGSAEVLIDVAAAGMNHADLSQRAGGYPPPPGAPAWLGMEVSGTIAHVGVDVVGWSVGDEVCALLPGGGYAERVAVHASLVLPRPEGVSLVDAAALPEAAATVWSNVFMLGELAADETLLVHGGTSGIGSMAIQVARALGADVITTVGSAAKVSFVESLGARGLNYHEADFVEEVKAATDGHGADVILDLVGGDYLPRNVSALAVGGRVMVIANQSGEPSTFALGSLMMKRGRIHGTTIRPRPLAEKAAIIAGVRENVWPLIEGGAVRPVVDHVLPLAEAAEAHRQLEAGGHIGKFLLRVR
ncbi:NAD(P)H-quinone oxidoreductase [Frondihabitans australicus]|uniref:NAD(P)H-quinone oxidoreductase n=1 Tax=Frondihabitans australicus TaxID=386892 RepID=UPI000EB17831